MADSSTGGYLEQLTTTDENLSHFFHDLIVGVTGLGNTFVRPSWQGNPPVKTEPSVNWMAYGEANDESEAGGAYLEHQVIVEVESQKMTRHDNINITVQSYGPDYKLNARKLRDSMYLGQNNEALYLNSLGFTGVSSIINAPEFVNGRWYKRCDFTMSFKREVKRTFDILSIVKAEGEINTEPFETQNPE